MVENVGKMNMPAQPAGLPAACQLLPLLPLLLVTDRSFVIIFTAVILCFDFGTCCGEREETAEVGEERLQFGLCSAK